MLKSSRICDQIDATFAKAAFAQSQRGRLRASPFCGQYCTSVISLQCDVMVKTRKTQPVLSALPASNPAVVPVISALAEEIVSDKELASEPCAPSTSGDEDTSRPVRVYADGKAEGQGLNASLRVACGPDAPVLPRHI